MKCSCGADRIRLQQIADSDAATMLPYLYAVWAKTRCPECAAHWRGKLTEVSRGASGALHPPSPPPIRIGVEPPLVQD